MVNDTHTRRRRSGGSKPEIQEEGRVMKLKKFCLSVLGSRGERRAGCDLIKHADCR